MLAAIESIYACTQAWDADAGINPADAGIGLTAACDGTNNPVFANNVCSTAFTAYYMALFNNMDCF